MTVYSTEAWKGVVSFILLHSSLSPYSSSSSSSSSSFLYLRAINRDNRLVLTTFDLKSKIVIHALISRE